MNMLTRLRQISVRRFCVFTGRIGAYIYDEDNQTEW